MVGGYNNGGAGVPVRMCVGRTKNGGLLVNRQWQRRDVQAQCHDFPEGGVANVATLRSNVSTLTREAINPTSRRWDLTLRRSREW